MHLRYISANGNAGVSQYLESVDPKYGSGIQYYNQSLVQMYDPYYYSKSLTMMKQCMACPTPGYILVDRLFDPND